MFSTKKVPKHPVYSIDTENYQDSFDLEYVDKEYIKSVKSGTLFFPIPNALITSHSGEEIISKNFNGLDSFGEHVIMFLSLESNLNYFIGLYKDKTYMMFTVDLDSEIIINGT